MGSLLILPRTELVYSNQLVQACVVGFFLFTIAGQLWGWIFALACLRSLWSATAIVLYLVYINYGPGLKACETTSWGAPLRSWKVWEHFVAYFPGNAQLVKTQDLDPEAHYIFCAHPHGIVSASAWINFATDATGFSRLFTGIRLFCCTLEGNFKAPIIREYCLLYGLRSASRRACLSLLSQPRTSILIVVGGAAESLLAAPGTYDVVLAARKGFVRVAMETGASLVPVINFGETDTYDTYIPPRGSLVDRLLVSCKRLFGFATPLFLGTGIMGGRGLLPKRVPLTTVVGAPLPVSRWDGPRSGPEYDAAVDALHARYVAELKSLWERHRDVYAKGRRGELNIR